jgi:hypothetical protein
MNRALERYLPPKGFERIAFIVLAILLVAMKVLAIEHFRSDSDETQHAHVVWGWVTGQMQYRDVFDNHMPLFQLLCAPIMGLLGQRADIMILLRWVLLPLYFINLWCVFRLTEVLYSQRLAPWSALIAGILAKFFYTSTEFRTDQLWTVFWLLSLVAAVAGPFTVRRALGTGLLLGLAGAVSVKTVPLVVSLGAAVVIAVGLALWWRERLGPGETVLNLCALGVGMLIPPALTILYFYEQGVFWSMYYCVIRHNLVPGLKRWGQFSLHQWYFPLSIPLMALYGWLIFRQTPDRRLALRRAIILLTPWLYVFLLLSYWPDITREDDLPYMPLVPLSLIPLGIMAGGMIRAERLRNACLTYGLPAVALIELVITFHTHNIREDRMRVTTNNIADVLELTGPQDYVMDDKGDYVYRRRAYYWVLEPITKARLRDGTIKDNVIQRITEKGTKLCSMICGRSGSRLEQFIVANYLPFDPRTRDLGALGQVIVRDAKAGDYQFNVTIPQTYVILTEKVAAAGVLDGKPYAGPVWLAAGRHVFARTGGSGRMAIFLADAYAKGFSPLYAESDVLAQSVGRAETGKPQEDQ